MDTEDFPDADYEENEEVDPTPQPKKVLTAFCQR
jgi:hypothetical protein